MAFVLAVAGKGGVGKTTICGMIIQHLAKEGKKPILAVDADANANLNEVLGVSVGPTLGQIREELELSGVPGKSPIPEGVSKEDYLKERLDKVVSKTEDFDLMVMGRPQGEGCYCFVNGLLQTQLQKLEANYPYIVVDNEAGMEHISRGVLPHVDAMVLVSDCSRRGVQAAGRIAELVNNLGINPGSMGIIINRSPEETLNPGVKEEVEKYGLNLLGVLPHDELVFEYDGEGTPSVNVPDNSPIKTALRGIIDKLGI